MFVTRTNGPDYTAKDTSSEYFNSFSSNIYSSPNPPYTASTQLYSINEVSPTSATIPRSSKSISDQELLALHLEPFIADDDDFTTPFGYSETELDLNLDIDQSTLMSSLGRQWASGSYYVKQNMGPSHNRETSLSSLGSAGPASPQPQNTSNPRIAVTDSDALVDQHGHENQYYSLAKPYSIPKPMDEQFPPLYFPQSARHSQSGADSASYRLSAHLGNRADRSLLPPAEFSIGGQHSHTASVASSVVSDSPATPTLGEPDVDERRRKQYMMDFGPKLKLERSMTDAFEDELCCQELPMASAPMSASPITRTAPSQSNEMFLQRVHQANQANQYLSATRTQQHPPSRDRSPFSETSQFNQGYSMPSVNQGYASPATADQHDGRVHAMFQQQSMAPSTTIAPQTVSPKVTVVDYPQDQGSGDYVLFSPDHFGFNSMSISGGPAYPYMPPAAVSSTIRVPQRYPFIAESTHVHANGEGSSNLTGTRPIAMEPLAHTTFSESRTNIPMQSGGSEQPREEDGTYSCTYGGCPRRFDTPANLQKHKKEAHRPPHGRKSSNKTIERESTQDGPFICRLKNENTNRVCGLEFSRPYDLTRHEGTIHNHNKERIHCPYCTTQEKIFSRRDALTRHLRVIHNKIEGDTGKEKTRKRRTPKK